MLLFGDELLAKVGDFGWCVELADGPRLTFCGTLEYVSPEMLCGEPHDEGVDLWALGVLLYEMLLSETPFRAGSKKGLMDKICDVDFRISPGCISPGPEELIRSLLVRCSQDRMPLKTVLEHEWCLPVCTVPDVRLEETRTELAIGDLPRPKARSRKGRRFVAPALLEASAVPMLVECPVCVQRERLKLGSVLDGGSLVCFKSSRPSCNSVR